MSSYEYKDITGKLSITALSQIGRTNLAIYQDEGMKRLNIDNTDAPTVAAELLKAAGQESVIVPKSEMPTYEVEVDCLTFTAPDGHKSVVGLDWTPERLRHLAMARLAAADYLESKTTREAAEKAEAEAAEKKLTERRDIASGELFADLGYDDLNSCARAAIDRIIELEDKLASRD